jgi:hypothetical protein
LDLLNPEYNIYLKAGSPLGFKHSEKTREIQRTIAKRRKLSIETRLKIGASLKGRIFSAKTLAKLATIRLGSIHSEETKAKISDLALGRKHLKETKDKIARIGS